MKTIAIVCSKNQYFLDCLSGYVMDSANMDFDILCYQSEADALNFMSAHRVDMVLADEFFLRNNVISEGVLQISISNRTRVDIQNNHHELNIYQRGMDILGDMRKVLSAIGGKESTGEGRPNKVVAFYSPQGGSGKTTLAYICALLCARENTSVYLNLEEFGYTDHLYQVSFQTKMEDILYALKDNRDVEAYISNGLQKDARNVTLLPAMKNHEDLESLSADKVEELIGNLQQVSGAKVVFVDISGSLTPQNRRVLELSDSNFWVFDDTDVGWGKMKRLRDDESERQKEYISRSYFVVNKCRIKSADTDAIRLPWSESLSQGVDVETVLAGNKDFYTNCMEIMKLINR